MTQQRKIIVHIATSADGFIARPDGDIAWLTSFPAPEGFYGIEAFMQSIDTLVLGRKTYEAARRLGETYESPNRYIVFSRSAKPADAPASVEFFQAPAGPLLREIRTQPGKDIWLMGGGEIIAMFLDEQLIDEFVITMAPVFIGAGIPLMAPRHRHVALKLLNLERFKDGMVQVHYRVKRQRHAGEQ